MKLQSINTVGQSFKGIKVLDSARYGYPETHLSAAMKTGKRHEKTLGNFHPEPKNAIYYADPREVVTDVIKEDVDYVFYDDEPKFPDIDKEVSKAYFYPNENSMTKSWEPYVNELEAYKQYCYRLEMADRKFMGEYQDKIWNNVNLEDSRSKAAYYGTRIKNASDNQETAANCINIIREASDKINKKDKAFSEMGILRNKIEKREEDVQTAENEFQQRTKLNDFLASKLQELKSKKAAYAKLSSALEESADKNSQAIEFTKKSIDHNEKNYPYYREYKEAEILEIKNANEGYRNVGELFALSSEKDAKEQKTAAKFLKDLEEEIVAYTKEFEENKNYLEAVSKYKASLPAIITSLNFALSRKTADFERLKAELIPQFEKLKNYFYNTRHGLRNIRF